MSETDFAGMIEDVARALFTDKPNKRLSTDKILVWGSQGSMKVDLEKGVWKDWDGGAGGGTIGLVEHHLGCERNEALKWLTEEGFLQPTQTRVEHPATQRNEQASPPAQPHEEPPSEEGKKTAVCGYKYRDADGNDLYQVVRYQWKLTDDTWRIDPKTGNPAKTFLQRRKDAQGNIVYNLDGIGHTIYRHPEVEIAIAEGQTVFLVEGEKDCETLVGWGLCASTNSGGAKNWSAKLAEYFKDADVVIIVDNDDSGREGGEQRARSLRGIAKSVRVLDLSQHIPDFPNKLDITDWKERFEGSLDQLKAILDQLPGWQPQPPISEFGAVRMADLSKNKIAYEWLVKGMIERRGVFFVAGEKQSGKSFFQIDLSMKIAMGADYCGQKVQQGLVIYAACEDPIGVEMRSEGYIRDKNIDRETLPFVLLKKKLSLMDDKAVDLFISECLAWEEYYGIKLELVTIDTFSVATEGLDEISSKEVGLVLGRVNLIAEKLRSSVCLVHHLNGEGLRVRGHSSLTANVSQVIELRVMTELRTSRYIPPVVKKDTDGRPVRRAFLEKNKNGPNQVGWKFVLRQIKLGQDQDGFEITTCVLDKPSSEVDDSQVKTGRLSNDQKLVFDALSKAIATEGTDIPATANVSAGVRLAVKQQVFAKFVSKVWPYKESEDDARKKELSRALSRNVTALVNSGFMGRDNDLDIVWLTGKNDKKREVVEPPKSDVPAAVLAETPGGVPF